MTAKARPATTSISPSLVETAREQAERESQVTNREPQKASLSPGAAAKRAKTIEREKALRGRKLRDRLITR